MKVLGGDIGGTNTRLALFELEGKRFRTLVERTYSSRNYETLHEIVESFVESEQIKCDGACFGIAGPVRGDRVETTNLPWVVEAPELAVHLGTDRVGLINDLEANAYGIATLDAKDFQTLSRGDTKAVGNLGLIAAGTGLGEAALFWDGKEHRPFACEGGHTDFAPEGELETALHDHLSKRFGHVSWERVLSGPGLANIHSFLVQSRRTEIHPCRVEEMPEDDRAAAISQAAFSGSCPLCGDSLDLFVKFYGAEASNLALKVMATGGLYIGGGIAPKIAEKLKAPGFMEAFHGKGRMRPLLEAVPVRVILNDRTALLGAARCASLRTALKGS